MYELIMTEIDIYYNVTNFFVKILQKQTLRELWDFN